MSPVLDTVAGTSPAADLPVMDPARPALRYDFAKAWRHFKELVKDKENTAEVAPIFEALPWRQGYDAAKAFLATEQGQRLRATEPFLPTLLDDHDTLRKLPKGSLAHVYCDFMEREGLTAHGLVEDLAKYRRADQYYSDQVEWYFNRMRDTHDLQHVLSGYGRDALGEQCVLAFTYGQQPALAHLFLGYAGALEIRKRIKSKAPILRAVRKAQRMGNTCRRIIEQPIRELLAMPYEEARKAVGITTPHYYQAVHSQWRSEGIDPYDLLAAVKKAA
ncbi:hypothetical protein GCM10011617_13390 [Novosphingobium arvoryzae]|uniref:Ubiquinone biosynthesis protein COQ4 n=2 Tax=Novosphingobium arvoryzae TaxID=1256514 RepID=A0A918REE9_9SPHN|nr:hypothetical protein GCM10011617_13390 [Novosphingobium arvoryzae]